MIDILQKIAANKRIEIEEEKITQPLGQLISNLPPKQEHRFLKSLSDKQSVNIIAEIKKGSPSKGIMSENFDVQALAQSYTKGGAKALSILTEKKYFYGSYENIKLALEVTDLPLLCKDFFIDIYQIYKAHTLGASAFLIIVSLLTRDKIEQFLEIADDLGIDALVEVHNEMEMDIALEAQAKIIGINNRDLRTFEVSLEHAVKLSKMIPENIIKVAESGIASTDDIKYLRENGFNNFLIGETLVRSDNPEQLLAEWINL